MYRHHKKKIIYHEELGWHYNILVYGGGVHVTGLRTGLQGQLILLRRRVGLQFEPVPAFTPLRGSLKLWKVSVRIDLGTFLMPHVNTDRKNYLLKTADTNSLSAMLWIRILNGSGFNGVHGSRTGFEIWIRIQDGKNDPQNQCCGSGMFIPDPDFYPSRIQKQQQKSGVKKNLLS